MLFGCEDETQEIPELLQGDSPCRIICVYAVHNDDIQDRDDSNKMPPGSPG